MSNNCYQCRVVTRYARETICSTVVILTDHQREVAQTNSRVTLHRAEDSFNDWDILLRVAPSSEAFLEKLRQSPPQYIVDLILEEGYLMREERQMADAGLNGQYGGVVYTSSSADYVAEMQRLSARQALEAQLRQQRNPPPVYAGSLTATSLYEPSLDKVLRTAEAKRVFETRYKKDETEKSLSVLDELRQHTYDWIGEENG